jgi:hypothetical protein
MKVIIGIKYPSHSILRVTNPSRQTNLQGGGGGGVDLRVPFSHFMAP